MILVLGSILQKTIMVVVPSRSVILQKKNPHFSFGQPKDEKCWLTLGWFPILVIFSNFVSIFLLWFKKIKIEVSIQF